MRLQLARVYWLLTVLLLSACGGGGGSSSPSTLSGIASAGAPIAGASISLLSANGRYYEANTSTNANGTFELTIDTQTYTPPYLLKITKTSGQSAGSYYAFASTAIGSGLLVTPISSATLGLAVDSNLEQIFQSGTLPASLNASTITLALNKIYAATSELFSALAVSDKSLLLSNPGYVANGEGQDASLDALIFSSSNSASGSVVVGSKLTGTSQELTSTTQQGNINPIPFSNNGGSLLVNINKAINSTNACIKDAINTNQSNPSCIDDTYLGSGITKANFIARMRSDISQLNSVSPSAIRWCLFENPGLSFNSSAALLANASGTCNASFTLTAPEGSGLSDEYYQFRLNATGTQVLSVKAIGNGVNDELSITPAILAKLRVDGYATNTGVTSGYAFRIGTALLSTNGNPVVQTTSNISAKVEIVNANGTTLDTFYMQCNQGATCIDSNLAVCKNKHPTCADGVIRTSDNIISVDSTLANTITTALQQGFVQARVTAYNKILSDPSKQQRYQKTIPIIGLPIPQETVNQISFPALTTSGSASLASWAGGSSLTLGFDRGDSRIALMNLDFVAQPSAGIRGGSAPISQGMNSVTFNALTGNGTPVIGLTNCAAVQASSAANWRAVYIHGTFANVPVVVKQFGSCNEQNY